MLHKLHSAFARPFALIVLITALQLITTDAHAQRLLVELHALAEIVHHEDELMVVIAVLDLDVDPRLRHAPRDIPPSGSASARYRRGYSCMSR